jgi:hypothetical protein
VTSHGIGNDLLCAYQRQRKLPALMEQTKAELEDYSRQTNLRSSRVLNALVALFALVGAAGVGVELYALFRPARVPSGAAAVAVAFGVALLGVLIVSYSLGLLSRRDSRSEL